MFARVSTYAGPASRLDDFVAGLRQNMGTLREFAGFEAAYMLVNGETGDAMTLTLWDGREAEIATSERASTWRREAADLTEHSVESVVVFEVAVEVTARGAGPEVVGAVV